MKFGELEHITLSSSSILDRERAAPFFNMTALEILRRQKRNNFSIVGFFGGT